MRNLLGRALAVVCVLASPLGVGAIGCDDEDPAVGQCRALIDQICNRVVACGASTSMAECRGIMGPQMPCDTAIGVSATYNQCMTEIPAIDCSLFSGTEWLPASCVGVILTSGG